MNAATFAGLVTISGNTVLGSASGDDITFTGSLASSIPLKTQRTYDIGAADIGLRILYLGGNSTHTIALSAPSSGMAGDTAIALPPTAPVVGHGIQGSSTSATVWAPMQTDTHTVSSADYTILTTDGYKTILVSTANSNRTITLPAVSDSTDRRIRIKKTDSGTGIVIIDTPSTETIDGSAQKRCADQYDFIELLSDGTNWHIEAIGGTGESHIRVQEGSGYGSTDTKIRRFNTLSVSVGNAITRASTAGNGDTFTINQDGVYSMHYSDLDNTSASGSSVGISLNSAQLTTNIESITETARLAIVIAKDDAGTAGTFCSATRRLAAGDIIRVHTDGGPENTTNRVGFSITKVRPC